MGVVSCTKECCNSCVQIPGFLPIPGKFAANRQEPLPLKTLGDWEPDVLKDPITRCSKDCCAGMHQVLRLPKEINLPVNMKIAAGIYANSNVKPRSLSPDRKKLKKEKEEQKIKKLKAEEFKQHAQKVKEQQELRKSRIIGPERKLKPKRKNIKKESKTSTVVNITASTMKLIQSRIEEIEIIKFRRNYEEKMFASKEEEVQLCSTSFTQRSEDNIVSCNLKKIVNENQTKETTKRTKIGTLFFLFFLPFSFLFSFFSRWIHKSSGLKGGMNFDKATNFQTENYDSTETSHDQIKFVNKGTDCFVNAALQLFRKTDYISFMQTELLPIMSYLENENYTLCKSLINMYDNTTNNPKSTSIIRKYVAQRSGKPHLNQGTQEDAEEFLRALEQIISEELNNNIMFPDIRDKHWGKEYTRKLFLNNSSSGACGRCNQFPSTVESDFLFLKLSMPFSNLTINLSTLIENHYAEGTQRVKMKCSRCCIHDRNGVPCPQSGNCNLDAVNKTELVKAPEYLFLQLIRYDNTSKIMTKVHVDEEVTLPNNCIYETIGLLNHQGSSRNAGHYVTYLKSEAGNWLLYNDEHIYLSSLQEANSNDNYILLLKKKTNNINPEVSSNTVREQDNPYMNISEEKINLQRPTVISSSVQRPTVISSSVQRPTVILSSVQHPTVISSSIQDKDDPCVEISKEEKNVQLQNENLSNQNLLSSNENKTRKRKPSKNNKPN